MSKHNFRLILFFLLMIALPAQAQTSAVCGVVDSIGFPITDAVEITNRYDDFALYRQRFGGLHVGIDIGFERWGDPVYAAARGRVTYSNPEGWDTEKGVVIIEHTFPDGSTAYSLYGHVEQTNEAILPPVGLCVERGDLIAAIGWPSRGLPHLHYEIRSFLPDDGGPGYVETNPLEQGWYHPIDFTMLWQMRLSPGFVGYTSFDLIPSLPPVLLESGAWVVANGDRLALVQANNTVVWRSQLDSPITGLAALSGSRVAVRSNSGQVVVLDSAGRYLSLWQIPGPDVPFVASGDTLAFVNEDGAVLAYDSAGALRWSAPPIMGAIIQFEASGAQIVQVMREGATLRWRILDVATGAALYEADGRGYLLTAPAADGTWSVLEDTTEQIVFWQWGDGAPVAHIDPGVPAPRRGTRLAADGQRNLYALLTDAQHTLASLDANGGLRWTIPYAESAETGLTPLLATDGRLVYTLDVSGVLRAYDAVNGDLRCQSQLYAGGLSNSSPRGRLLRVQPDGSLLVGAGFLTTATLNPVLWCVE